MRRQGEEGGGCGEGRGDEQGEKGKKNGGGCEDHESWEEETRVEVQEVREAVRSAGRPGEMQGG